MVRAHHLFRVHFQFRFAHENCVLLFSQPVCSVHTVHQYEWVPQHFGCCAVLFVIRTDTRSMISVLTPSKILARVKYSVSSSFKNTGEGKEEGGAWSFWFKEDLSIFVSGSPESLEELEWNWETFLSILHQLWKRFSCSVNSRRCNFQTWMMRGLSTEHPKPIQEKEKAPNFHLSNFLLSSWLQLVLRPSRLVSKTDENNPDGSLSTRRLCRIYELISQQSSKTTFDSRVKLLSLFITRLREIKWAVNFKNAVWSVLMKPTARPAAAAAPPQAQYYF